MDRTKTLTAAAALGAVLVAPALAQQQATTQPTPSQPAPSQPTTAGPGRTAPSMATATSNAEPSHLMPSGTLVKSHDEWRASKLVGQTVYDENGQTIGTVDDLMVDDQGKISQAVISVGGFLGIGSKLVAVPYDQLKFEPNGNDNNNSATGGNTTNGAAATNATVAEQTANNPALNTNVGAAATARPNYYSVVMPGASKTTLTSMTEFRYAG